MAMVVVRVAGKTVFSGEVESPSFKNEGGAISGGGTVVAVDGPKKEGV